MRSAGGEGSGTAVVCHVGRHSGRSYRTPVVAADVDDAFLIALPYGDLTDWTKNVVAAGSATVEINGNRYPVSDPEVVPMSGATQHFRAKEQRLHKRFHVESALKLRRL
jgi:deazaflavin-dependent oxidoreductase (nitroreductase family)